MSRAPAAAAGVQPTLSWATALRLQLQLQLCRLHNRTRVLYPRRGRLALGLGLAVALSLMGGSRARDHLIVALGTPGRPNTALLSALTAELLLLLSATLVMNLARSDLAFASWDLEWLAALPLGLPQLLLSRILLRTLLDAYGFFLVAPYAISLAALGGWGWASLPLGGLGALALLLGVATLRIGVDTGLRLLLPPPQLRNLQALLIFLGALPLYLAAAVGALPQPPLLEALCALPRALRVSPAGLLVDLLAAPGSAGEIGSKLLAAGLQLGLGLGLAVLGLSRLLRHGLASHGLREASPRQPWHAAERLWGDNWLSPLWERELRLLGRDRQLLSQTLGVPCLMALAQVIFVGQGGTLAQFARQPASLAAAAFACGAHALLFSAFSLVNNEGQALWLLYCWPQPLAQVVARKARIWGCLALLLLLAFFVGGALLSQLPGIAYVCWLPLLLASLAAFLGLATALGLLACEPTAQRAADRLRNRYVFVYLLLLGIHSAVLAANQPAVAWCCLPAYALLGRRLWHRGSRRLQGLLDLHPDAA